jgi:hypothetical protein
MAMDNNPLKQYFRRPSLYIRLPSGGKYYKPGVVNIPPTGELAIYPMTAIDEITTKTPDALFNGSAMTELIKSCVPDIKDPWAINSIDLDAVLIGIRSAGTGNEMEIDSRCPACDDVGSYGINLTNLLSQLVAGDYDKEMDLNELKVKFRPITYKEMNEASLAQFEIQRAFGMLEDEPDQDVKKQRTQEILKNITALTMKILTEAIEYIQTPTAKVDNKQFILDFLNNCDKAMYAAIRDYNGQLKAATELKPLKLKCVHCQHDYEQVFTLNTADFFE